MPNDIFGIKKLYPSADFNNQEFILPMHASQVPAANLEGFFAFEGVLTSAQNSSGQIGWWEAEVNGDTEDVTMYISTPGNAEGVEIDCDMDHGEAAGSGSAGVTSSEWLNTETTLHVHVDGVTKQDKFVFVESRAGFKGEDTDSKCCASYGYGGAAYWGTSASNKGKVALYKEEWKGSITFLNKISQSAIDTFYQKWFGLKKVIYNKEVNGVIQVHIELYISPSDQPRDYQNWVRVYAATDYVGRGWTNGGNECGGKKDQPITWSSFFTILGWNGADKIRFKNFTIREIDPNGTFGEDPEPPPSEEPPEDPDPPIDPENPEPPIICPNNFHEENGICVPDNVPPIPPDTLPPATPTTIIKRLTLRREIVNSSLCSCDGIPTSITEPPTGGGGSGGGGGGGSNTLVTIYNVAPGTGFAKLAKVANNSDFYLRFGQGITKTVSPLIGKRVGRIEIRIAEYQNPRNGTDAGVRCRIRKSSDDSIAVEFPQIALEEDILNTGVLFIFEKLDNTYQLAYNDKILFEYDGGNSNNYIKIFRVENAPNTGTKIVWQSNAQDPGEYSNNATFDTCMRVYAIDATVTASHVEDDP